MPIEHTLSIIKPDAVERSINGQIISMLEGGALKIVAQRMATITREEAKLFYAEHKERPFFEELVEYMTSGPVILQVLEGEDAINKNRKIMGATNPAEADKGTIRAEFGLDVGRNSIHGSDSPESAKREISIFFKDFA